MPRSWEKEDYIFDPLHYLALIEQKTNALGSGGTAGRLGITRRPFIILRRLHGGQDGQKAENASSFRFCDCWKHSGSRTLKPGSQSALERGTIGFDAGKHLVLCRIERQTTHGWI